MCEKTKCKCHRGNVKFPKLCYTEPGVHTYIIKETTPSNKHWKTDAREYRAIVTVTIGSDEELVAEVEYPDGFPEFVNEYKKPKCRPRPCCCICCQIRRCICPRRCCSPCKDRCHNIDRCLE
ncbi:MAG: hypothetical protein FWC79_04290 [Oscillospiraceae bacterium]|nr:hypothetical protein [Oscillospiraceae bacterium]